MENVDRLDFRLVARIQQELFDQGERIARMIAADRGLEKGQVPNQCDQGFFRALIAWGPRVRKFLNPCE